MQLSAPESDIQSPGKDLQSPLKDFVTNSDNQTSANYGVNMG